MTEEPEKNKPTGATTGGIPGLKPPNPDDLPREYLTPEEQQERDKKEGLYGDFSQARQEQVQAQKQEPPTKTSPVDEGAKDWLLQISAAAGRDMAYYAGKTSFDIEFDDGKTIKFERVSPVDYQWDELEDLRAELEGGEAMDDGHKLTRRERRLKEKLLEQLKAKYYLINSKTREPMTPDVKAHVRDSNKLGCLLDACVICSLHKAVVGKK